VNISENFNISIIVFNQCDYATGVICKKRPGQIFQEKTEFKSCILQQFDLFENNVSQNNHLFVFAYSHQSGRHYRWLDAYQQFELGIQQAAMENGAALRCLKGISSKLPSNPPCIT
jgi:hypothetical protein